MKKYFEVTADLSFPYTVSAKASVAAPEIPEDAGLTSFASLLNHEISCCHGKSSLLRSCYEKHVRPKQARQSNI